MWKISLVLFTKDIKMWRCKLLYTLLLTFLVLCFAPGIPPYHEYVTLDLPSVLPSEGPLASNNFLDFGERLYENYLIAPESIAVLSDNEVFVGTQNGNIVKVWGKNFEHSKVIGNNSPPECQGAEEYEEAKCGRPLGLRMAPNGQLLIADSYLGIFRMDVNTGRSERLFDPLVPVDGLIPRIIDDLDIDINGNIYWSDASTIANLEDSVLEMAVGPSGRLVKYDAKTKKNEVLLKDVFFANGVQLSPKQDFILLCETFQRRVLRYWLKGPKAGTHDIFVSSLPGFPDNIRPRLEGGYYVSLVAPHSSDSFDTWQLAAKNPLIRQMIARISYSLQSTARLLDTIMPSPIFKKFIYKTLSLNVLSKWMDQGTSCVVEVDDLGEIVGSLQGQKGTLKMISETQQVGDSLLFASPYSPYLGRLSISKLNKMKRTQEHKAHAKDEL